MGAFAGSAALFCDQIRSNVSVVTLTMNNSCNLKCPHCYLQYNGEDSGIGQYIIDAVAESQASVISIVGMEPLKNSQSVRQLEQMISTFKRAGKKVGFITNGLNAHLLSPEAAQEVDWVDVSVDGTRATYGSFRGAPVAKLERGVARLHQLKVPEINILQTIHAGNVAVIGKMAEFGRSLASGVVIFSPFSVTYSQGVQQSDLAISPQDFLKALTEPTLDAADCWAVFDLDWLHDKNTHNDFSERIRSKFSNRAIIFKDDPICYGMIRVTYDGRVMTPRQAMHTGHYRTFSNQMSEIQLRSILSRPTLAEAA